MLHSNLDLRQLALRNSELPIVCQQCFRPIDSASDLSALLESAEANVRWKETPISIQMLYFRT